MGIFSRLVDIVNSDINALLASAEDPGTMIRLVIQEMEETLVEVRSQVVHIIAERKTLEQRARDLKREEEAWLCKAELALTHAEDDRARAALSARMSIRQSRAPLDQQIRLVTDTLEQQQNNIGKLQAKLAHTKSRASTLLIHHEATHSQIGLPNGLIVTRIEKALSCFEEAEQALDALEGKAEAYDLKRDPNNTHRPDLQELLALLETDIVIEDELASLRRKVRNCQGSVE